MKLFIPLHSVRKFHAIGCQLAISTGMWRLTGMMALVRTLLVDRRIWGFVAIGAILAIAVGVTVLNSGLSISDFAGYFESGRVYLSSRPWLLFLALVILPGFPFPVSALLLSAGVVWKDKPAFACGMCMAALALNFCWTYWLAAGPGKNLIARLLSTFSVRMPEVGERSHIRLTLLMRLTPGIPLFFQNYMLGILGVPFRLYFPLSLLCSGILSLGVILVGAGMADGGLIRALTGVGCLIVGLLLAQALRSWLARRKRESQQV